MQNQVSQQYKNPFIYLLKRNTQPCIQDKCKDIYIYGRATDTKPLSVHRPWLRTKGRSIYDQQSKWPFICNVSHNSHKHWEWSSGVRFWRQVTNHFLNFRIDDLDLAIECSPDFVKWISAWWSLHATRNSCQSGPPLPAPRWQAFSLGQGRVTSFLRINMAWHRVFCLCTGSYILDRWSWHRSLAMAWQLYDDAWDKRREEW